MCPANSEFYRTSAIDSAVTIKNQQVNCLWKTRNDYMDFKNAQNLNSPTLDLKLPSLTFSTLSTLFDSTSSLLPLCCMSRVLGTYTSSAVMGIVSRELSLSLAWSCSVSPSLPQIPPQKTKYNTSSYHLVKLIHYARTIKRYQLSIPRQP